MLRKFRQIQIATDETTIRLAVARAFRDTSVDVVAASNTFQALSQLDVFIYDLFLLDLDMKDGCAFGLLETMTERFPRVPVILTTTGDIHSAELIHKIKEIRFNYCWNILSKPFDYSKLVGFICGNSKEYYAEQVPHHQQKQENWLERRNCQRFFRSEQISISRPQNKEARYWEPSHWSSLTNISLGGMSITTDLKLNTGARLNFDEKFMHQSGEIVWIKEKVDHLWKVGIKFF
jgi:DNA-binding response OmpR family regulator